MTYPELLRLLYQAQFTRVERDDRLLDIFPTEEREKGIELWECWHQLTVEILRVRLPFTDKALQLYEFSKTDLETLLQENTVGTLTDYEAVAEGKDVARALISRR